MSRPGPHPNDFSAPARWDDPPAEAGPEEDRRATIVTGVLLAFTVLGPVVSTSTTQKSFRYDHYCYENTHSLFGGLLSSQIVRPEP